MEGIVQEMYDSKATEKPNMSTTPKPLSAKREISMQISSLVIPSNPFSRELPMDKANFLMSFNDVLNEFERKEISNLAAGSVIYFAGDIPEREFLPNKLMEPPMR